MSGECAFCGKPKCYHGSDGLCPDTSSSYYTISDHHKRVLARCWPALLRPLRETAKSLGYALAVHGSEQRDIDLIAVPWIQEAAPPRTLAEALFATVEREHGFASWSWSMQGDAEYTLNGCPSRKPHGRLGWVINLGGGPYLGLAVFGPEQPAEGGEAG